ncbi:MAG: hypothetical protein V1668_01975 [Patescibacteria group bacterium]
MLAIISLFLPLLIQVAVLYGLSRLLSQLVLRHVGRKFFLILTWPGVVAHELSHLTACLFTFTRVTRVSLFNPQGGTLGFVEHEQTHHPVKKILISIAPLFGVTALLWVVVRWIWPDVYQQQLTSVQMALSDFSSFHNFFKLSVDYIGDYWKYAKDLVSNFQFNQWQTYVGIYLLIAFSTHTAPSKEDLKHTYIGLFGAGVIFALMYGLDQWLQVPITWQAIKLLTYPVFVLANFLTYGIIFALIGTIPWLFVGVVWWVMSRGKRVSIV